MYFVMESVAGQERGCQQVCDRPTAYFRSNPPIVEVQSQGHGIPHLASLPCAAGADCDSIIGVS
jgi:hypothetical protein